MNNKNRFILILILILFISIGFAYLSTNLFMQGSSIFRANSWDIYFDNVEEETYKTDIVTETNIENKVTINSSINLKQPKSTYTMYANIVNDGSIDAMLDSWSITNTMNADEDKVIDLTISYADDIALNKNDLLYANSLDTIKVTAIYKDDISNSELLNTDGSINLAITLNYVQADEDAIEREYQYNINYELNGGTIVNNPIKYTTKQQVTIPNPTKEGYTFVGWTGGKNMFNVNDYIGVPTYNAQLSIVNDTIIWKNTTVDSYFPSIWRFEDFIYKKDWAIPVKPNTDYVFNSEKSICSNEAIYIYEGDKNFVGLKTNVVYKANKMTFKTTADTRYIIIRFAKWINTQETITVSNIQLEESKFATEYVPYITEPVNNLVLESNSKGNRTYYANWIAN